MSQRVTNGILITIAVLLWLLLLSFQEMQLMVNLFPNFNSDLVGGFWYRLVLTAFLGVNLLFFSRLYAQIERLHVSTMLWRIFLIGMIGITLIMLITFANRYLQDMLTYKYVAPILLRFGMDVMLIFFLSAMFIFRRFILYPRTKRKITLWRVFIGFLIAALLITLDGNTFIGGPLRLLIFIPYALLAIVLSINVKWISYLNFNQKLRALGLFVLITIVSVTYIIALARLPVQLQLSNIASLQDEFLLHIIVFTLCYCLFSLLGLFFNLPTTSVFERESSEIVNFDKINQAIQSNLDFTEITNTLLDVSMMSANAKAGWVEMINEETGQAELKVHKRIQPKEIKGINSNHTLTDKVLKDQQPYLVRNTQRHKAFPNNDSKYRCLLVIPIMSSSQTYGAIFVANELADSFEDVAIQSITTYAEQAGIALENARLMKASIEMERYQEQLKIAQEVQTQLLPQTLPYADQLEFGAKSETAFEVGGDYFDIVNPKPNLYRIAIGDVSGKGTTAAFYMAEIKGIFHALTQLELDVKAFLSTANLALSQCMQKGFFMTMTYLEIDLEKQMLEMVRAGHCPAFFYKSTSGEIQMLREGTLGLGIVRNASFGNYIKETEKLSYESGDVLILYTDGILEARNEQKEEFGYERFEQIIGQYATLPAQDFADKIVESVRDFTHTDLQDDYTVLIIRFR
ncbi:MAG: GAF domain-containing SpoIIE family protein phosphatase [Bacteroidota bacterium]